MEPQAEGQQRDEQPEFPPLAVPPPPPPMPEVLRKPPTVRGPHAKAGSGFSDSTKAWAVAMDFVFTILGALLLGYFADRWWGTAPKLAITGLVVGFSFALWRIIRRTLADEKREREERDRSRSGSR